MGLIVRDVVAVWGGVAAEADGSQSAAVDRFGSPVM
jgi:hypothetical protein